MISEKILKERFIVKILFQLKFLRKDDKMKQIF